MVSDSVGSSSPAPRSRRSRQRNRRRSSLTPPTDSPDTQQQSTGDADDAQQTRREHELQRQQELAATPYVALTIRTTGIHPSTARIVAVDAVVLDPDGEVREDFHAVINPNTDCGPTHLHGLSPEDVAEGKRFSTILKPLGRLIDGRTLITHDTAYVWGFIHSEARRTMAQAARSNRSRGRAKTRRRHRVGHIPKPVSIVDTLDSARRAGLVLPDTRIRTVAYAMGITDVPATATVERSAQPESSTSREETLLVADMFFQLRRSKATITSFEPDALRADRFGLQHSLIRVDAMEAPRDYENPGIYRPETGLVAGMEIAVAPEISIDTDTIIEAILAGHMAYSEKVTRKTSLVVCNFRGEHTGKAMHATRKGIPLVTDTEFLKLATTVAPGTRSESPAPHIPRVAHSRSRRR